MIEQKIKQIVIFDEATLVGNKICNTNEVIVKVNDIVKNNNIDNAYYDKEINTYIIPYMEKCIDDLYITIKNRCTINKEYYDKMLNRIISSSKRNHKFKQKELMYKKSRG